MFELPVLPPEISSPQMYGGDRAVTLSAAANSYVALSKSIDLSRASFAATLTSLLSTWSGAGAIAAYEAGQAYMRFLDTAGTYVASLGHQAMAMVGHFENALSITTDPLTVFENRVANKALVATNILAQNTGLIAQNEAHYQQMWINNDIGRTMYRSAWDAAQTAINALPAPLADGLKPLVPAAGTAAAAASGGVKQMMSQMLSSLPMMFVSMGPELAMSAISPLMSLVQMGGGAGAPAAASAGLAAGVPAAAAGVAGAVGAIRPVSAVSAAVGQARTVGSVLSVPQSWASPASAVAAQSVASAHSAVPGVLPARMAGPVAPGSSGMPMMPMPGGMAGAGAAAAGGGDLGGGMAGRGGAGWSVLDQARPTVVPRQGIG